MQLVASMITIDQLRESPLVRGTMLHLVHSIKVATPTKGHVAEFGVYQGGAIQWLAAHFRELTFHGFDSFTGLPDKWDMGPTTYSIGHFNCGGHPPKFMPDNVKFHVGWFKDSIPVWLEQYPGPFRFIDIDSDIYQSAKDILTLCNDRLIPGTVIYFDEIGCWSGNSYTTWEEHEFKALNEWLVEYDREVKPLSRNDAYGASVVVVR